MWIETSDRAASLEDWKTRAARAMVEQLRDSRCREGMQKRRFTTTCRSTRGDAEKRKAPEARCDWRGLPQAAARATDISGSALFCLRCRAWLFEGQGDQNASKPASRVLVFPPKG